MADRLVVMRLVCDCARFHLFFFVVPTPAGLHRAMTLDSVGRNNLPEVVLGDEREELETESGFGTVRLLCSRYPIFPRRYTFVHSFILWCLDLERALWKKRPFVLFWYGCHVLFLGRRGGGSSR